MDKKHNDSRITRRGFIKKGATLGLGAATLSGLEAEELSAQTRVKWDREADVVIAGAGASGLCAAISARDRGATVIAIDENHDVGGHALLSGGNIPLGGGTSLQKKYGIADSADQVYLDNTDHRNPEFRHSDRDLIRVWADENAPTFEFLFENGVKFNMDTAPRVFVRQGNPLPQGSVARIVPTKVYSEDLNETIAAKGGSGVVRPLEKSARAKGVEFLLRHKLTALVTEKPTAGRVLGITAKFENKDINIRAKKGVILCTGGHSSNVDFRRMFDPRLTEEYQVAGEPWSRQNADGEILALRVGASLWGTSNISTGAGTPITKTIHIGCRWGYSNLKWNPKSPTFDKVGASGLTVINFQDIILVNQSGLRFWNELDNSFGFLHACLGTNGNLGKDQKKNGGGPIWAIFDADAVTREKWEPRPPNVDLNGWFFSADTLADLAKKIVSPYQYRPLPAAVLEQTVSKYNSFVDTGKDPEFNKPTPMFKVQKPPFYAAWATPILHDSLAGIRINGKCQVVDLHGQVIPGLYCAGESAGGFGLHGLPRVTVFGRIAGREAANASS
jgi:urocanate reductase